MRYRFSDQSAEKSFGVTIIKAKFDNCGRIIDMKHMAFVIR